MGYGYHGILGSWSIGIHDVRGNGYQHPWLAVLANDVIGCWSRAEAREVVRRGHA